MSKILFLSQPMFGHFNPLFSMALQMQADGHEVEFLIPGREEVNSNIGTLKNAAAIPKIIEKNGIPVELISMPIPLAATFLFATSLAPKLSGYNELEFLMRFLPTGLKYITEQVIRHIERSHPDAIATDYTFLASYLAAEVTQIPCAVIYQTGLPFRGKSIPPFGSGLPIRPDYATFAGEFVRKEKAVLHRLDRQVNRVRRQFGLPDFPPEFWRQPYSQWLNLVTSIEAIEAPRDNLTDNTFFVGPSFSNRSGTTSDFPFDQLRRERYKIYVSFGTMSNDRPHVLRKIMKALARPEYQVIISAGTAYSKLVRERIPENVLLCSRVPQVDLLPQIDLAIIHGGNNTTNETLAAGKPAIVMPIAGEQGDNASRVEYLGVGLRLNIERFDEQDVLAKVQTIQSNPGFQARATELKAALDLTNGSATASALIHQLAETQKPVVRSPANCSD
ncbi:glycosyltransferase [Microseira sp. BLCC-F43]|jgi:MGT family glycosyltransferase|uniref:glycosyltransferase n=1 Tax=Microseira sp. BLCC-F43 TaxID=3153602 RepID=UPI0035B9B309